MTETLISIDRAIFLFLNGLHGTVLDPVMYWGSASLTWLPLYVWLLYIVIRKYRWQTIWILLFIALAVTISDQLANVVKTWVARPRPTHVAGLQVHTVYGYTGGAWGFWSSHASNTMAIAVFLIRFLKGQFRYFSCFILAWAVFMSYTRIYLGVHYPGDIMAGWLAGSLIGWGASRLCIVMIDRTRV